MAPLYDISFVFFNFSDGNFADDSRIPQDFFKILGWNFVCHKKLIIHMPYPSVLDFLKINWKNPIWQTGFLVYFELDFYRLRSLEKSILKLIFAGQKSNFSNLIFQTWFFKNQAPMDSVLDCW